MKTWILVSIVIFTPLACIHTTKIGSLIIENNTDDIVVGKASFTGESSLGNDFAINAHSNKIMEVYDIKPGSEQLVLHSITNLQVTWNNCTKLLNTSDITEFTHFDGVSVIVKIGPEIFQDC